MSWKATIPGQAMSTNHIYKNIIRQARNGRRYNARTLTDEAQAYFDSAVYIFKAAKPRNWHPEGQIRVVFDLYLARDIDSDNTKKLVLDALEAATEINDSRYLDCTRSKVTGLSPSQARIEVEIFDLSSSPSLALTIS